jgi:hypothetical protein
VVRFDKLLNPVRVAVTLGIIWILVGGSATVGAAFGRGKVCATLPVDGGPPVAVAKNFAQGLGLIPHSQGLVVGPIEACVDRPEPALRLASVLASLPLVILILGALVLAAKLVWLANGNTGLYVSWSESAVRYFGWYMIVGSVAVAIVESVANAFMVQSLAGKVGWAPEELRVPLIPLAAGLIIIAFSRAIRERELVSSGPEVK